MIVLLIFLNWDSHLGAGSRNVHLYIFSQLVTLKHSMKKRDTSTEDIILYLVKSPVLQNKTKNWAYQRVIVNSVI